LGLIGAGSTYIKRRRKSRVEDSIQA
jgi:hypothetical protein